MLEFELIDDTENIELELENNEETIDLELTDYDDTEVRELIEEVDTKVDDAIQYVSTNYYNKAIIDNAMQSIVRTIDTKQDTLVSGTNIKTVNNQSLLGSGNIEIEGVTDYPELNNLPQVNGVTLTGNKTSGDLGLQPAGNYATSQELTNEATARENADINLQGQIDAITSSSDVKDIVGTYQELQSYDTSTLGNNDIVKVLQDSTHDEAMSYYRWVITAGVGAWIYIGSEAPYYTKSEADTLLNTKQNEINSSNKLLSDLVDDTNQTNLFVTNTEKTTWNDKADEGFTGIITGTSANPTDGASLPNGVYKADESKAISYINLLMEDETTKKQSVQRGGIVIRTAGRLIVLATQNLMYQYNTSEHYFYEPESLVESWVRSTASDGYVDIGTLSSPNNKIVIGDIYSLEGIVTAGDVNHVKLIFKVVDDLEGEPFEFNLTTSDSEPLLFEDGAVPEFKEGMTYILDFYGHNCEIVGFKESGTLTKDDLLKQFMRRNSDQIYYPSLDGKPNVSIMAARGYSEDRKVGLEAQNIEFTNFENWTYYGIPNYVPLDLSLYNTSARANQLFPYEGLPDGDYWVKNPGRLNLGDESFVLNGKEFIHKRGLELTIVGGDYAASYYAWEATEEKYKGGFFTTEVDVLDAIADGNFEKGLTITKQTTTSGTITANDGRWFKRVNNVNSLTLSVANLSEIPDTFKARVTVQTSATFTTFNITQRSNFTVYFAGWDCENGVIKGKPNAFYNIEYKADGKGNIIAIVNGYDVPTT